MHDKLEERIKRQYWNYYLHFRDIYGLKLNYSVKELADMNEVKLFKRLDKKWFKQQEEIPDD